MSESDSIRLFVLQRRSRTKQEATQTPTVILHELPSFNRKLLSFLQPSPHAFWALVGRQPADLLLCPDPLLERAVLAEVVTVDTVRHQTTILTHGSVVLMLPLGEAPLA